MPFLMKLDETASRVERYYKAANTLGKGGKVERLRRGILEDIQLLATIKTMTTDGGKKDTDTATAAEKEELAKIIRYTFVSSNPKPARPRDIPEKEKPERETPERKKGNLAKSTLNSIIKEKFERYTDNKGRDTFTNAAELLKDGEYGIGYAYRLSSRSFDP